MNDKTEKSMAGSWRRPAVRGLQAGVCALALWTGVLSGQTLTTGAIAGTVRGPEGQLLADVSLTLTDAATGSTRTAIILPGGNFEFAQLTPGQYELLAERVGYRPKRVLEVPVRPVTRTRVDLSLTPAPPPVGEADVEHFAGVAMAAGGTREWFDAQSLRAYPDLRRELSRVGRLSSLSAPDAQLEGLPAWMTGVVVDGIATPTVRHPGQATGSLRTAAFPLGSIESAELVTNGLDVEWPGDAGGLLSGYTLRGTRGAQVHGYGAWSGGLLGTTSPDAREAGAPKALAGGLIIGGPMAGDSAHVLVGVEGRRIERSLGAAWAGSSAAALQSAASQGLGVDLGSYLQSRTARSDLLSGFARVDWLVTPVHSVDLRASVASIPTSDAAADEPWTGILPLTSVKGTDFSLGGTLRSLLGPALTSEFRLGIDRGKRDYTIGTGGSPSPLALVASDGFAFGGDAALPGSFTQTTVRVGGALQFQLATHEMKFGAEVAVPKYDQTYLFGESGQVFFGSIEDVAAHDGIFAQPTGPAPQVNFSVPSYAVFVQDRWSPLAGLDLLGGVRVQGEQLPRKDVVLNESWQHLTNLSNADLPGTRINLSPRGGLVWDLGLQGRYILEAGGGLFYDRVDPAVLAQLVADNGRVRIRRGAGVLTGWPTIANGTTVSSTAPGLTLLASDFRAPRTARGTAAFTLRLGEAARARVSGVIRHTEFLPRANDLNQLAVQAGQDQFGRPLWGSLIKKGALVAALPGSNRRFTEFDAVTAFTADGVSDYRAITLALERPATRTLGLTVGYTISSATDTWLGSGATEVAPTIVPALGASYTGWADGTADLDVPQRFVAGATLAGPAGSRLGALFRYASGRVFTPGFGAGVDANGDGVAGNDPAFVDAGLASELINQWSCLRSHVGAFAARNSCRGPAIKRLDARLAIPLFAVSGSRAELRLDALDLLDSGPQLPDPALYLVNSAGTLTSDASGRVSVPLVANPNFGKALGYSGSGRTLLLGLALNW